jgi:hypothetical protein
MLAARARNRRNHVLVDRAGAGGDPPQLEDPADRGGTDAIAELAQFALDARITPARVLAGQPFGQCGDGGVEGRAPGAIRVGPLSGHQAAMPAQDGGRGDRSVAAPPSG